MPKPLHILGYALLALIMGFAFWFVRDRHDSLPVAIWFGVCMVAGVVIGNYLRRLRLQRRAARATPTP